MSVGAETRELMSRQLGLAADQIGAAVAVVEMLARMEIETVRKEPEASDKIAIDGPELVKAMRQLQGRLNRGY